MLRIKNSYLLILSLIIISCKTEKGKILENVTINSELVKKEKGDIMKPSKENLTFDLNNEYINYIINFDEENFSGMYLDLTGDEKFVALSNNPDAYLNDAKLLLMSDITTLKKEVVIISMYDLSMEKKLYFLDYVFSNFKQKILSEFDLFLIISGCDFENQPKIIYNYKKTELRILLTKISKDAMISRNLKTYITDVLSGKVYDGFKDNR